MQEHDFKRYMLFDAYVAPIGDEHLEQIIGKLLFWIRTLAGDKQVEPEDCIPYHKTRRPRRRRQSTGAMKRAFREARESVQAD